MKYAVLTKDGTCWEYETDDLAEARIIVRQLRKKNTECILIEVLDDGEVPNIFKED